MVVEDDRALQKLYADIAQQIGWEVELAVDGQKAIDLLNTGTFHVIFLDILLPMVNGIAVLQHIADNAHLHRVHVVIASASHEYERHTEAVPSAEFLLKPVLPGQIRHILKQHHP